jgi:hypothetical protein
MRSLPLFVLAAGMFACKDEPRPAPAAPVHAPTPPSSQPSGPASSAAAVSSASVASSASAGPSASAAPSAGKTCEVEIFGTFKGAPATSKVVVYVAQNDCLAADAQILGHLELDPEPNAKGARNFMIEVFPRWGSDVTICAAAYAPGATAADHWTRAKGTFHAEAEGEVTFNDVELELSKGKPKVFPKDWDQTVGAQVPSGKTQGPPNK